MIKNNVVNKDRNCGRLNDFHMPTNNLFADKINDSIAFSFDPFSLQHYYNSKLAHPQLLMRTQIVLDIHSNKNNIRKR